MLFSDQVLDLHMSNRDTWISSLKKVLEQCEVLLVGRGRGAEKQPYPAQICRYNEIRQTAMV